MKVIHTQNGHINEIINLYNKAILRLKSDGVDQWQNGYPNIDSLKKDMEQNESFVIVYNNVVIATCAISVQTESTYLNIDGSWLNDNKYVVIHRITSDKEFSGCSELFLNYIKANYPDYNNIRIDTHIDNLVMQGWLKKHQFTYTGIIKLSDGSDRLAYQLIY